MKLFKTFLLCLGLLTVASQNCPAQVEWLTDAHAAMDKASAEKKVVLLDFTGTDWCPWCIRLRKEVFDTPEFAAFARANLVMVEVDFPRHKELTPEQHEANAALAKNYNIRGYPTIVLINALGQEVGRSGYGPGGPVPYIAELQKIPGVGNAVAAAPLADNTAAAAAPRRPLDAAALLPVATVIPMHYGELKLKGLSGSKGQRMALINNQSLMVGETAKVKVNDGRVEVTCQEIREDSVLITVDGKPQELKLGEH